MEGSRLRAWPGVADPHLACLTGVSQVLMSCGGQRHGRAAPAHTLPHYLYGSCCSCCKTRFFIGNILILLLTRIHDLSVTIGLYDWLYVSLCGPNSVSSQLCQLDHSFGNHIY